MQISCWVVMSYGSLGHVQDLGLCNYCRCWHHQFGILFLSGIATHSLLSFELEHSGWQGQGGCCRLCWGGCWVFLAITLDPAMAATAAHRTRTMELSVNFVTALTVEVVVGVIGYLSFAGLEEGHGILFMPEHVLSGLGGCSIIVMCQQEEMSQYHQLISVVLDSILGGTQIGLWGSWRTSRWRPWISPANE